MTQERRKVIFISTIIVMNLAIALLALINLLEAESVTRTAFKIVMELVAMNFLMFFLWRERSNP